MWGITVGRILYSIFSYIFCVSIDEWVDVWGITVGRILYSIFSSTNPFI